MSIVAWDGKTLAADRMGVSEDMASELTKMRILFGGKICVAWTGIHATGMLMAEWYEAGADLKKYPACQNTDDWSRLIVLQFFPPVAIACPATKDNPQGFSVARESSEKCFVYERHPVKLPVTSPFMAWGSGRDFAIGAMSVGASAKKAVEVACQHCWSCGRGVDNFPSQG